MYDSSLKLKTYEPVVSLENAVDTNVEMQAQICKSKTIFRNLKLLKT